MATPNYTITVNRPCTRCPRVERTEVTPDEVMKLAKGGEPSVKALVIAMENKVVVAFDFLCTPCRTIINRYLEHVAKEPKKQSALRGETKIEVEED